MQSAYYYKTDIHMVMHLAYSYTDLLETLLPEILRQKTQFFIVYITIICGNNRQCWIIVITEINVN